MQVGPNLPLVTPKAPNTGRQAVNAPSSPSSSQGNAPASGAANETRSETVETERRVERPFSAEALQREGEARALQRPARDDNLASAPRNVQDALLSYTQTATASTASGQGELAGIDIFV